MANPFLAEIRIASFNFAPKGWALCNGQLLPINQNQALFALLGINYGGNGQTTFALPNLQGRMPVFGSGYGTLPLGSASGEENHTLSINEIPLHTHQPFASNNIASQPSPGNNVWPNDSVLIEYSNSANGTMAPGTLANAGGSQSHNNMPPFLVLNFIIALQGIFPSQN